jgi:hypothetical protein
MWATLKKAIEAVDDYTVRAVIMSIFQWKLENYEVHEFFT